MGPPNPKWEGQLFAGTICAERWACNAPNELGEPFEVWGCPRKKVTPELIKWAHQNERQVSVELLG